MTLHNLLCGLLLTALVSALPVHGWAMGVMAQVSGSVVLCSEGGPKVVAVDRRGAPVEPHRDCPDCLPGFGLAALDAPGAVGAPIAASAHIGPVAGRTAPVTRESAPNWPRAPPV